MSRLLIFVLALFAISDVQVALARLGNQHRNVHHVTSWTAGHPKSKIRKTNLNNNRRRLADDESGKEFTDQLHIMGGVERPAFRWENVGSSVFVAGGKVEDDPEEKKNEEEGGSD